MLLFQALTAFLFSITLSLSPVFAQIRPEQLGESKFPLNHIKTFQYVLIAAPCALEAIRSGSDEHVKKIIGYDQRLTNDLI
jgi:hypothetical protein